MSDASIIKEFLVALGFKLDAKGQAQMQKGITGVTAAAVALGEVIEKAAEKVAKAVVQMVQDLDQLYFTSRRVNSAAENVKAFGFSIEQLGGDAKGAQSALEGIASFMRSNPGGERFIQGLGVATRDANGKLRDTELIAEDLGKQFAKMPFYMAKVRAAMLGIDEKTLLALIQGPGAGADKYREFAQRLGLGMDAGADASNKFAEKVRDLKAEFGLLFTAGATQLMPMLQGFVDWLSRIPVWFESIKDQGLGRELTNIAAAAEPVVSALKTIAQVVSRVAGPVLGALASQTLKLLADALHIIGGLLTTVADLLTGKWGAAWTAAKGTFGSFIDTIKDMVGGLWNVILAVYKAAHRLFHPNEPVPSIEIPGAAAQGGLGAPGANPEGSAAGHDPIRGNQPVSVRNNNPGNLVGSDGKFRHFDTMAEGYTAMQAQILRDYWTHGQRTIRSLIDDPKHGWSSEWAPGNSHASASAYVDRLAKGLGISADAQFSTDPATLQRLMSLMAGVESGGVIGSAPLASAGAHGGVGVNQKTDIHISGVHDPVAAGRVVTASLERVNGNLVRNLKTAVA
jgi:hypothetical protein